MDDIPLSIFDDYVVVVSKLSGMVSIIINSFYTELMQFGDEF